jgi:LruC domain-containing protein/choice-of-anchor A domain-containing protein
MKTTLTRLLTPQNFTKVGLTAVLFSLSQLAHAQQSPTAPALGFNVFVKNSATLNTNETDGPVAMGGNLLVKGNYVVAAQSAGTFKVGNTPIGLLIGGKIDYQANNRILVNNGYVKVGNATGSTVYYKDNNGANANLKITNGKYDANSFVQLQTSALNLGVSASQNPVIQGGLVDFAKAFSTLQANSKVMAAMSTNIEFTNPNGDKKGTTVSSVVTGGQVKVNLKNGVNVINTTGKEINAVDIITFNTTPNANRILVINVNAEGTFSWKVWNQAGLGFQNCPYIIYNFYNTTTLQIQGNSTIEGTVFAPMADINKTVNQSNIEGQVIGLSYWHSGGENHYAIFNASLGEPDADGDSVPDSKDDYPNDNTKAFNNPYPAKGMSTLMYEDLWPFKGDYDFNDLVIDFRFNTITDASNNIAQIEYKFVPKASGAVTKNAFAFQLDGINPGKIVSVTGSRMAKGWSALNSNGTEAGHSANANIIVFDYANTVFNGSVPAGSVVNTFMNSSFHTADTITIVVKFQKSEVNFTTLNSAKFNPYLIVDQTRGREVHLPNRMPTAKMDASYFGKGNDNSSPSTGKYFKTKNNLPWALEIATSIPYAQEMIEFSKAYPNFIKWAESNGTSFTDWYLNKAGNRDASKLYNK